MEYIYIEIFADPQPCSSNKQNLYETEILIFSHICQVRVATEISIGEDFKRIACLGPLQITTGSTTSGFGCADPVYNRQGPDSG
jgi:hypothetical protein